MALRDAQLKVILSLEKKGFDKGVKETQSNMKDLGKDFLKSTAAIAAVGLAIYATGKQIYEVGKRGAIVTQTGDSFEYLSEKIGLAPDLLEQLRKASRGTIDDMTLMSSTATLLAGTSDELGKSLGDATPRLLEIAKAANKLNPSLGTTSHMYESIALGIKRASPLILDNLGLTIKIGDANEAMAKQLGKSVDALTAEEKQMALLNATLAAGDKLLAQVGGSTESATDSFAQLETVIANTGDEVKKGFVPPITRAVEWVNKFIEAGNEQEATLGAVAKAIDAGRLTQKEADRMNYQYLEGIIDTDEVLRQLGIRQEYQNRQLGITAEMSQVVIDKTIALGGAFDAERVQGELLFLEMDRGVGVLAAYRDMTGEAETATGNWSLAMAGAKGALEGLSGVLDTQYQNALKAATSSVYELERMKLVLKLQTEDLSKAEIEHSLNMLDSIDRMGTLTQAVGAGEVSQRDFKLALADGKITLGEFNDLMGITTGTMDGTEKEAYELRSATGLLSSSLATAAEKAYALEGGLHAASGHYRATFTTTFRTYYEELGRRPPSPGGTTPTPTPTPTPKPYVPPPPPAPRDYIPVQKGIDFDVPFGYPNDSFYFPMALSSGEHVEVTPRSEVRREIGGSNVTINNNYLNIQTNAPVESDVPDLLLLRAWASG